MKNKWLIPLLFAALAYACNDDSASIGFSIDTTYVSITIDSSYVYTQNSDSISVLRVDSLPNRTVIQMLGQLDIPDYGSVKADYLSQFYPVANFDTVLVKPDMVDSVGLEITFQYNSFLGDSLAPMQLTAYRLSRLLRETRDIRTPIYSNLDPADYYSESDKLGSAFYVASTQSYPDSLLDENGYRTIKFSFGTTTDEKQSWARKFYDLYIDNAGYLTADRVNELFKGIYVTNTFGRGTLLYIISTAVNVYHRSYAYNSDGGLRKVDTSDPNSALYEVNTKTTYLMSSYEAPTINRIEARSASVVEALRAQGAAIIQSPQMYDAQITLPIDTIIHRFNKARSLNSTDTVGVLNIVNMTVPLKPMPASLKSLGIVPPPYLLLMRKGGNATTSSGAVIPMNKDLFFTERLLADNRNYFVAAYDSTTNSYSFVGLQDYIINIFQHDPNSILEPDGALKSHLDNNYDSEMILVPISLITSTSKYGQETSIVPYLGNLTYAEIDKSNIKITVAYSTKIY